MSRATDELLAKAVAILGTDVDNEELALGIEAMEALGEEVTGNSQEYKDLKKLVDSLGSSEDDTDAKAKAKAEADAKANEMIPCIVRSLDREEKDMVFGHNGNLTRIKLGVEVELTRTQIKVIKDATMIKYEAELDEKGDFTGKNTEYKEPRYIIEVAI